jgi:CheY-like chemotaxis protein
MREQDEDGRSGRMIVLALESEPAQAATIRHVVCDLVGAELTLVKSVAHALHVLHTQRPDLILLPMFVAPADEAELLAYLRTLPNGAHIETQITPVLGPPDETTARHGWRRWRARPSPINSTTAAEHHFAERLSWSLEQRREQQQANRCRVLYDASAVVSANHAMVTPAGSDALADTRALPLDQDADANHSAEIVRSDQPERRQYIRVDGPFDGCRHGVFDMPVLIHNLSESGCFIDSLHGAESGRHVTLGVQPSGEDWITVKAEVVRGRPGFGFAVRFVEMPVAVRAGLARVVASRPESAASQVAPGRTAPCNVW